MSVVIIGSGEVGLNIATRLSNEKKDVIVIERDPEKCQVIENLLDCQVIQGKGTLPNVLSSADIKTAEILVAVTQSDEANLMSCFVGHKMNPNLIKVARVRDKSYFDGEDLFSSENNRDEGVVDFFIQPERVTAEKIFNIISRPEILDCSEFAGGKLLMIGIKLTESSLHVYRKIYEIALAHPNLTINPTAVIRNEDFLMASKDLILAPGDTLYLACPLEQLEEVVEIFVVDPRPRSRIMVMGGDRLSWMLTEKLIQQPGVHVKHVEVDEKDCPLIEESNSQLIFLVGDPTEQSFLASENIHDVDVFVAASPNEEDNILAALMAKKMGAKMVISRVNKGYYFPIANAIGIDVVVAPRMLAIGDVLKALRKGRILSISSLGEAPVEIIEFVALDTSEIVDKPIKEIDFPKGSLVASIVREQNIIVPKPDSIIRAGDTVVMLVHSKEIPKIERALTVKLSYFN